MKKKLFCIALVLVLCLSAYSAAFAATRQASGYCFMNNSGRSVYPLAGILHRRKRRTR